MAEIQAEAAVHREKAGTSGLGRDAVLKQDPYGQPLRSKKSPAPRFHAASKEARLFLYNLYAGFVAQFREAAERLRAGDRNAHSSCPSDVLSYLFVHGEGENVSPPHQNPAASLRSRSAARKTRGGRRRSEGAERKPEVQPCTFKGEPWKMKVHPCTFEGAPWKVKVHPRTFEGEARILKLRACTFRGEGCT